MIIFLKKLDYKIIALLAIIFIYFLCLLYKLSDIPNVFVDESNYMNEVISFANFGTDINGFKFPIYLESVWGQGQSVMYCIFVTWLVKLFGFSIFLFRLPMVILNVGLLLLVAIICYYVVQSKLLSLVVTIVWITSPWAFISSRWVLDANVGPILYLLSVMGIYVLTQQISKIEKAQQYVLAITCGVLFAMTAYSYISAWLYLPIAIIAMITYIRRNDILPWRLVGTVAISTFIIVIPLVYFAYTVNIVHITTATHFLFFDIPPLPGNRTESLIDFGGSNVFSEMIHNFIRGIKIYFEGSDNIPWNSIKPFGVVFPWLITFSIVPIFTKQKKLGEKLGTFKNIIAINLLSFLPLMFVILPNYNHWNFIRERKISCVNA